MFIEVNIKSGPVRDESCITRFVGGGGTFLLMYWGGENKKPLRQGVMFHQVFGRGEGLGGGLKCVPLG